MKFAAILAFVVAFALGAWAISDYHNNEEMRRDFMQKGITYFDMRTDSGQAVRLDLQKMLAYYERHDAMIGVLSAASLFGSIALFWRRSKAVKPVDSN